MKTEIIRFMKKLSVFCLSHLRQTQRNPAYVRVVSVFLCGELFAVKLLGDCAFINADICSGFSVNIIIFRSKLLESAEL